MDFFTPVVDDPYWFGRIAAANALSDVWAMGARPLFALNLVGWPVAKLPMETLGEILRGGAESARLAGAPILGGHSIDDPEPKYGMAVTGIVHPDRVLRNVGARPGDVLLLTKPLGSGIVTTAIKQGKADAALVDRAVEADGGLNRAAGEILAASGAVHALTDVTGFGLLGHALGDGGGLRRHARPARRGGPGPRRRPRPRRAGRRAGRLAREPRVGDPHVRFADGLHPTTAIVLADAQTNGGLLAAVDAARAEGLLAELRGAGVGAVVVGDVRPGDPPRLEVIDRGAGGGRPDRVW